MNRAEFKQFYKYITAVSTDTNPSAEKTQVYWDALNDLPFNVAMIAAKKVIATLENPFLPMPAVFRKAAIEVTNQQSMTAAEGWGEAQRAIRNYGYYREVEGMESLSPLTKRTMQSIGWQSFCASENEGVLRGQFIKLYEQLEHREEEKKLIPKQISSFIEQITNKKSIEAQKEVSESLT